MNSNYAQGRTNENRNEDDKYSATGESEYSRERTVPFDEDEHFNTRSYARSDKKIKDDVLGALYRSTEVDSDRIEVFVEDGEVCLKGQVKNEFMKNRANVILEHIPGVDRVLNLLSVDEADQSGSNKGLVRNRTGLM